MCVCLCVCVCVYDAYRWGMPGAVSASFTRRLHFIMRDSYLQVIKMFLRTRRVPLACTGTETLLSSSCVVETKQNRANGQGMHTSMENKIKDRIATSKVLVRV